MEDKNTLETIISALNVFRDERNWREFHSEKNLAVSISIESAELLECFQWLPSDVAAIEKREEIADELADVLIYAFMLADDMQFDIPSIIRSKMLKNSVKYPVHKARGTSKKYDEL
ncbi:nucleotide pyrophosphohydrolase [Arcanobacterium pinnipediorum]|uniref:Nucleotide pyrophosphohydrolase n=1 Tax=Arcanobacterium pinnipediorum TaxID=1503041 RepID=A0ABY5AG49_9ACTO|nr:nucleotide pyrophosphohydrolase [Arcanobacterium pinnipediorum]USR79172.1 nucleotide pyrophosphohydrolase [Arcanobacterium pinnipediorum]